MWKKKVTAWAGAFLVLTEDLRQFLKPKVGIEASAEPIYC